MLFSLARPRALQALDRDGRLLFGTRVLRMFAYGFLSVVLVLYLAEVGLSEVEIGLLLTLTLVGDTAISLWITTSADRIGRRRMLVVGALLMVFGGGLFALTRNLWLLLLAADRRRDQPEGRGGRPVPVDRAGRARRRRSPPRSGPASSPGTTSSARSRRRSGRSRVGPSRRACCRPASRHSSAIGRSSSDTRSWASRSRTSSRGCR